MGHAATHVRRWLVSHRRGCQRGCHIYEDPAARRRGGHTAAAPCGGRGGRLGGKTLAAEAVANWRLKHLAISMSRMAASRCQTCPLVPTPQRLDW